MPRAEREHRHLKRRALRAGALAMAMFCCVSGGPFGLEQAVLEVGPSLALLLIAIMPFLWALPDALTTAELAPAIPVEGGYIVWVRRAMGPFAGFLNGWWTWIYALLDAAIYPVLFATYLGVLAKSFFGIELWGPEDTGRWAASVAVIALFAGLNVRGTATVGAASYAFAGLILLPFALLVGVGAWRILAEPMPSPLAPLQADEIFGGSFATGLAIVMWNYLGWDQLSTVAEEVDDPARSYPRAIFLGVPLVALAYLLPVGVGVFFLPEPQRWTEFAWLDVGSAIGGMWIAVPIALAMLVSPVALFTASLLASSRVPFVMAEDGFLPRWFVKIDPKFGTPVRAIAFSAVIYAVLAYKSFAELVELNVLMYSAALALESASLVVLRIREPNLPRPFKIPGGLLGASFVCLLPIAVAATMTIFSIREEGLEGQITSLVALGSGPVAYAAISAFRRNRPPVDG